MPKEDRRITVFKQARGESDDWPPVDPIGFFQWFHGHVKEIPCEHHPGVEIDISSDFGEWSQPEISITYTRKETDEEFEQRIRAEKHHVSRQEKKEKRILAKLLAKYGTHP